MATLAFISAPKMQKFWNLRSQPVYIFPSRPAPRLPLNAPCALPLSTCPMDWQMANNRNYWESRIPRRSKSSVGQLDMQSLCLRKFETSSRRSHKGNALQRQSFRRIIPIPISILILISIRGTPISRLLWQLFARLLLICIISGNQYSARLVVCCMPQGRRRHCINSS